MGSISASVLASGLLLCIVSGFCTAQEENASTCEPQRYSKVLLNQTSEGQYIEYAANVPALSGFTLHYWIQILQPLTLIPTFSYLADGPENKEYIQVTLLRVKTSWYSVLQVKGVVVSNTKLPGNITTDWHHLLHSWDGNSGIWSVYFNGKILDDGESPRSKGLVVKGGGRAFTGHQASSIMNSSSNGCADIAKFEEGIHGWVTLLALDSRGIDRPQYWFTRMAVAIIAEGCRAEHRGDVISWLDTPRRGYCGAMEARANNICRNF
ncbi:sushi, von Willebrand factor type A, EGF and pentraxin domain-containing protein 1-like [Palaemon carinicauda]|uniref:sushi, von Willebrand factor type A, EGF and pentraxin domain-containing protein 1-like n=1 Tax=Palaemon carinicauda TaxID=392227 RepID=UPI0035B66C9E